MTVITRFAPSPTGFLHIGNARTALFNWLYAKANNGKFLLRVEDTDIQRSTDEAIDAIINGIKWLGLNWNDEVVYQSKNAQRHVQIVNQLLAEGKAYKCYCTKEELDAMREKAKAEKRTIRYDGTWREADPKNAPKDIKPVVRLKAPLDGQTVIEDKIQGKISTENKQLDDMILLRSDGTPTYMLAVVVDDHDMKVTDIIRGDDHLTNSFRQKLIYDALGWQTPTFAHVALIHGEDGTKLSKRHGALGVDAYEKMGYLPESLRNYLLRLGWSHGDDEIISTEEAIKWFNTEHIGKSPSRFDFKKLDNLNKHYIIESDNQKLFSLISPIIGDIDNNKKEQINKLMDSLKQRAKTINELAESVKFLLSDNIAEFTDKARTCLDDPDWTKAIDILSILEKWNHENIEENLKSFCEKNNYKLGKIMGGIRAAITGSHMSPSMFEIMEVLGKENTLLRLRKYT